MSRALSLAGFQVTFIGRFWVIAEGFGEPYRFGCNSIPIVRSIFVIIILLLYFSSRVTI